LRAAIVQHHAPGFVAELPFEIGDRDRRNGQELKLLHQLRDNGAPVCLLFVGQRTLGGVKGAFIAISGRRIAPQFRATARANGDLPPQPRGQAHHDPLFNVSDALAGDQHQRDPLFKEPGEGSQHPRLGGPVQIGHRFIHVGQHHAELVVPEHFG
jgi:hypothetical protein